jgi:L1 cell adhesion molecule like protein
LFNIKTTITDDQTASRLSDDDKSKINEIVESTIKWLDSNQSAEKEEFEHKLKEIEKICSPIMTKLYRK